MILRPMTEADRAERENMIRRVAALQEAGVCPTCRDLATGGVFPSSEGRAFYEDDLALCLLEAYPRNPGHTILLVKPHYEDLAEIPAEVSVSLVPTLNWAVAALKAVLSAEKVYLCTMCDGKRNHLHFQLIPRLPGDQVRGSRLFVKERQVLGECGAEVKRLSCFCRE